MILICEFNIRITYFIKIWHWSRRTAKCFLSISCLVYWLSVYKLSCLLNVCLLIVMSIDCLVYKVLSIGCLSLECLSIGCLSIQRQCAVKLILLSQQSFYPPCLSMLHCVNKVSCLSVCKSLCLWDLVSKGLTTP